MSCLTWFFFVFLGPAIEYYGQKEGGVCMVSIGDGVTVFCILFSPY